MEEIKNRTCEIRAGDHLKNDAESTVGVIKTNKSTSESDDNLLNLIAEIVVENMVRKIRNESKQRKELIKKD
jgi:hypothetical protein